MKQIFLTSCASLGLLSLPLCASAQEVVRVAFGTTWPTFSQAQIAAEDGLFGDVEMQLSVLEDVTRGYQMLAVGQIDVLFAALDYAPIAAAQELPFKLVTGVDVSYGADQIVLAPDITPADLKGAKVGATEGFLGEIFMTEYLRRQGLAPQDVTWMNISPDQVTGPMLSGDIAAAYIYEPWTSGLQGALPGTTVALASDDPEILASGILEDALYMSDRFLAEQPELAKRFVQGYFDAVAQRQATPEAINQRIAGFTQWPLEDVEFLIGADGQANPGGMYVIDFAESARQCGVLEGAGPLGQPNGSLSTALSEIEAKWIERGTLKAPTDDLHAILDCSLQAALVDEGYAPAAAAGQ